MDFHQIWLGGRLADIIKFDIFADWILKCLTGSKSTRVGDAEATGPHLNMTVSMKDAAVMDGLMNSAAEAAVAAFWLVIQP